VAPEQDLQHVAAHAVAVIIGPLAHGGEQSRLKADVERKHINGREMAEAALEVANGIIEVDADADFRAANNAPARAVSVDPIRCQCSALPGWLDRSQPGYRVMMYAPSRDTAAVDRACDLPSSTCSGVNTRCRRDRRTD
jgi:hypothetical protein